MRRFVETLSTLSAPVLWLLFFVPMDLFADNVGEVGSPVGLVFATALAVSLAVLATTTSIVTPLPRCLRLAVETLAVVCLAGALLHFCLPVGTAQSLDGSELRFTASATLRYGSLAATVLLGFAILRFRRTVVPILRTPFAIASVFLVAVPALRLGAHRPGVYEIPGITIADLAHFSSERNVLVLLLDAAQSDVAAEVLEEDESLRLRLRGFTFYDDALGVFPSTFVALPLIHAGATIDDTGELRRRVSAVQPRSFVADAAAAGWQTQVVAPAPFLCAEGVRPCASLDALPVYLVDRVVASYLLFVDLTLLRTLPYSIREEHYAEGRWTAQRLLGPEIPNVVSLHHNDFLRRFAVAVSVDAARLTLKVVHVMSTHLPFDLGPDCTLAPASSRRAWRARARDQVRCGLAAVAEVIDALRASGILSRTAIVIAADHGSHVGREVEADGHLGLDDLGLGSLALAARPPFEQLASSASPLLATKPFGEVGATIARDDQPRQLSDVSATVCVWTDTCGAGSAEGRSLLEGVPRDRKRRYAHSPIGFGTKRREAPVWIFEVSGPIPRERSWRLIERGTIDSVERDEAP